MKNKKLIVIITAVLLICLAAGGILLGLFGGKILTNNGGNNDSSQNTQVDVAVVDEAELRELLANDSELVIQITEDMELREGFVVNGTKTLMGDAKLTMALGAELGQALLVVSNGSALTLDGPVLDCNYNSDGIHVEENATLNCLSGTVKYAGAYGILTYGDVTIEDIKIEDSEYISICAQTGSNVHMNGGSIQRSSSNDIYVVTGAHVNISGDTIMEGALEHAMINYGKLELHGGKFGNVNNYLCDNYGELTVAYKGEDKDGCVEFYGARNSIFLVRKGSVASFSDVYIHDTSRQGIASLGGDTSITNCKFENTGSHSIDIQAGKAIVENVIITASKGSGLEASNGSEIQVTNFTVNSCEKIGIASRGANITAKNVSISNTGKYGLTCGTTKTGEGMLIVEDVVIKGTTMHGVYVYDKGNAELKNIKVSEGTSRGMYVAATATCKVSGNSSFMNLTNGGVEVRGTLQMDNVIICDNNVANSGAGLYVADGGEVTLNGGAIYNNKSELRGAGICVTDATLSINGTKVYDNASVNHGGGLYVQKNSVVNLNSGDITKNYSAANGDGIYILSPESKVMVGEDFYLGGNDVKLDNIKAVLHIEGNGLKRHTSFDPLLLTPNYDAAEGTVVATCKDANVAKELAAVINSGDGSYYVEQNGSKFEIGYTAADMDMTGADTVYVSNFEELEDAVLSTTSKRNIVLKSDIQMERRLRVPGGATICIIDDGTKRTLSRATGFTDSFFVTHYGTGLYLTGTDEGKLVLDGAYKARTAGIKTQSLVRVAGSTELRNVVLQNNGTLAKEHEVRGALVRQLCGDIEIYDSVLSGGNAYAGGALLLEKGKGYIEGTTLSQNESTIGGGAIRVAGGSSLEVVSSKISDNHAGTTGGGIVALETATVSVKNTTFEKNMAVSYGGAVSAQDLGTKIKVIGTDSNAIFENNSSKTAGAVYMVKHAQLEITGYTFVDNKATAGRAGAVSVIDKSSAIITNSVFFGNKSSASGGAFVVDGSEVDIVSCQFGKENAGNEAGDKAGALLVTGSGVVNMTAIEDGKYNSFNYNAAQGVGGVVYVEKDSTLNVENYIFEGNKGASGGAIYIVNGATAVSMNNEFRNNTSISGTTYGNGGAVYCAGTFTDNGSSYYENSAKNGGAIIVMGSGTAMMDAADTIAIMQDNTATVNGGAVFVNGGGTASITGYQLKDNTSDKAGSIQIQETAEAKLTDLTFTGDTGKEVYVKGNVHFNKLTGVTLVDAGKNTSFVISGYETGDEITFVPYEEESKVVFKKDESMSDEEFAVACTDITVKAENGENKWSIDKNGVLVCVAVSITVGDDTKYFSTLKEAVEYANEHGGTGDVAPIEIVLVENVSVNETINVAKNITILSEAGQNKTISRGKSFTGDMFVVVADSNATLTLGTNSADESGKLIVDGVSEDIIAGRIVDVQAATGFVLSKNVILCNANGSINGAAIQTASTRTFIYGTIKDNVSTGNCGGLYVLAEAKVTISGAIFEGNKGGTNSGALRIDAGAEVVSENATFSNNKGLKGTSTYVNGGAVYCAGTFNDTDSTYIGNVAKNGGAIIVMNGGNVTLMGTDATKAIFKDNQAVGDTNSRGGAIFVNNGGCSVTITGYSFEGNTSSGTKANTAEGALHIVSGGNASLKDIIFQGSTTQKIYVAGNLTFNNVTGTHLVAVGTGANIAAAGYQSGNVLTLTPSAYTAGNVALYKADAMKDEEFEALCGMISVIQTSDERHWSISKNGKLVYAVASITIDDETEYFNTLGEAVVYANNNGKTGEEAAIEIVVFEQVVVDETISVAKNITIVNASGMTITISRGASITGDMFVVQADSDAMLTLGTNSVDECGEFIVDGASSESVAGRIVTVEMGAGFTLAKNATLCNANSSITGAAIQTASTSTIIYGTIKDNVSTADCGGLNVLAGAKAIIDGAIFEGNKGGSTAGALRIVAGAEVICENAIFSNNKGLKGTSTYVNGGAVYCAGSFTDTNSTYIGNVAKNGGAIVIMSGGKVTLTGTDDAKAIFKDNQATGDANSRGGAIFVNSGGCTVTITGYSFEGNTSSGTKANTAEGALHIVSGGNASLKDIVFQGSTTQKIYVAGNLTFNNVTGTQLVMVGTSASITTTRYKSGNTIEIQPNAYTAGSVILNKADGMTDEEFEALCKDISIVQHSDGKYWSIDANGKLICAVASIVIGDETKYFNTLEDAVAYANSNGSTATATPVVIVVSENVSVVETLNVTKNVAIVNASGVTVTISRDETLVGDIFVVAADSNATLTLGTSNAEETGTLVVDAYSEAGVAGRIVDVQAGAGFVLAKNAILCNANSTVDGAAIRTAAENTVVYGTIRNNLTVTNCGGLYVLENARATISGATFEGNQGGSTTGALRIDANAEVVCENTFFINNKALKGNSTYVNGGAVYCAGTFNDTNSTYTGNVAKNGGAVIVMSGATATITGTDVQKAIFKDNYANVRGGAVFVNVGGTAIVDGYMLEGNVSELAGGIQIQATASAELRNLTFNGEANQGIYVAGNLTFAYLVGAHIVGDGTVANIVVGGYQVGDTLEFTPDEYASKQMFNKAEGISDEDFATLCGVISVLQTSDGRYWYIDVTGQLVYAVASITIEDKVEYFNTLEDAVTYANANGQTGAEDAIVIVLSENTAINETLSVTKNITIVNASGKTITISRGTDFEGDLFVIAADTDARLTLGTNDTNETGTLIVDATSVATIAARTVTVETGAGFTLAKNVTLCNANTSVTGGAVQTFSTDTVIYGTIRDNKSTANGAGLDVQAGAKVTIDGAIFSSNEGSVSGAALMINSTAEVTCQNATFEYNKVPTSANGGAIYCAGTFTDTNSTYIGNEAKNGGAIIVVGGVVTFTGTDDTKAIFKNNAAIYNPSSGTKGRGGAIFLNGGTLTVTGYTFEGNTCKHTGFTATDTKNTSVWTAKGTATLMNCTGLTE